MRTKNSCCKDGTIHNFDDKVRFNKYRTVFLSEKQVYFEVCFIFWNFQCIQRSANSMQSLRQTHFQYNVCDVRWDLHKKTLIHVNKEKREQEQLFRSNRNKQTVNFQFDRNWYVILCGRHVTVLSSEMFIPSIHVTLHWKRFAKNQSFDRVFNTPQFAKWVVEAPFFSFFDWFKYQNQK